jgi:hypothetical protein
MKKFQNIVNLSTAIKGDMKENKISINVEAIKSNKTCEKSNNQEIAVRSIFETFVNKIYGVYKNVMEAFTGPDENVSRLIFAALTIVDQENRKYGFGEKVAFVTVDDTIPGEYLCLNSHKDMITLVYNRRRLAQLFELPDNFQESKDKHICFDNAFADQPLEVDRADVSKRELGQFMLLLLLAEHLYKHFVIIKEKGFSEYGESLVNHEHFPQIQNELKFATKYITVKIEEPTSVITIIK